MMNSKDKQKLIWLGFAGLLGALCVGTGEWLMQFTQTGNLDDEYNYFDEVPLSRLSFGHFLCVISGPLYFLGYVHLGRALDRSDGWLSKLITMLGIYSFGVGIAWIGGRIYLALVKKSVTAGDAPLELLESLAAHNEPFIQILRIAILLISVLWVYAILSGRSHYPKWMAALAPILILISIFITFAVAPAVGKYILPTAMNLTHTIIFSLSLYHCSKISIEAS